ncbi:MAG TPA: hypothetical protein VFZ25_04500 [Chloroflexota bacterium]|nr:hypothetical protein [Chloroflexota bacterium]
MAATIKPFKVSNDALDDTQEVRRRLDDDGYLFVRGLLDATPLWDLRLQMLKVLQDGGWLQAGSNLQVVPSDTSRQTRAFDEALELARQGNELARPLLVRIVKRDPDSPQAAAAWEALRALDARTSGNQTS